MDEVYVVVAGQYSDFGILGIYNDSVLAQKFADLYKDYNTRQNAQVQIWPLNPYAEEIERGECFYWIVMYRDGTMGICEKTFPYGSLLSGLSLLQPRFYSFYTLAGYVWAKSKEHAINIANVRRIELIAQVKWPARGNT